MSFHQKPTMYVSSVHLHVMDIKRSLTFYQEVLGLKVLKELDKMVHFTADGTNTLLVIEQPEGVNPKQGRTTGLYHFAILLPERSDLATFIKHIVPLGVELGASDHQVSEAIYFSDPDGNGIEVYRDREPAEWNWDNDQVEMTVDPLDAEDLLAAAKNEEWNGIPEDTVMGHIHLHVAHLPEVEEFYTKGLGFEVVTRYGNQAIFISDAKYHHHIALNTWNGVGAPTPASNSVGLKHYTITLPNEPQRNEVIERLKQIGAKIEEENGHYFTQDPSDNRIKLEI
ncbi:catechol 2,3-dioxygenase [Gracilibacillus halotolerans]|uniref:Catechol 2,3-dioxygenase n=1 Tax=Gracilibacillus halotolerans TaxID=74386 RepID=A0A841RN46_9BACI|nr:VOC family protein [Gracilibacillus halotolerans]MBB6512098.1 catechol 2,3-dioxygenase [Gracilibacillus halotolerans]